MNRPLLLLTALIAAGCGATEERAAEEPEPVEVREQAIAEIEVEAAEPDEAEPPPPVGEAEPHDEAATDGEQMLLLGRLGADDQRAGAATLDVLDDVQQGPPDTPPTRREPSIVERVVRGTVRIGALESESGQGVFDVNVVTAQLRRRVRAIQACYERELRNNPSLSGRVVASFTVTVEGRVTGAVATQNTTGSPAVGSCVVNTVRRFRFSPGPEGGSVTYAYPFTFAPAS